MVIWTIFLWSKKGRKIIFFMFWVLKKNSLEFEIFLKFR